MTTFFADSGLALERMRLAKEQYEESKAKYEEKKAQRPVPSGIEALVCEDIARRQAHGIAKYGTTVADNPLTHPQWLQHAYEEALDLAVYLRRCIDEIERVK